MPGNILNKGLSRSTFSVGVLARGKVRASTGSQTPIVQAVASNFTYRTTSGAFMLIIITVMIIIISIPNWYNVLN
jgi:hypothetical protein